jgi:hypothetical protein
MRHVSLVLTSMLLASTAIAAEPAVKFSLEPDAAGIAHKYSGEYLFTVGGGVAAFDCNDDFKPDVFLAGGEGASQFYVNRSKKGGELRFEKHESGAELASATGAYPLDIDADGKMDLVILRVGENVVMKGEGNCKFSRANEQWNFDGGDAWSTAYAATWEKGANFPTIAIGNYVDRAREDDPWGSCTDNWLHRPNGGEKSFARPLALKPSYCPLSILFTDWNRSGTPALRMSNDREYYEGGQEQLWKVEPGKEPVRYTDKEGWRYLRIWGMGIADYDLNGDGYPDYVLSSMADNKLQALEDVPKDAKPEKPGYVDVAFKRGVTAHRPYMGDDLRPSTGWHTAVEDVNNDGLADIFIAKGNVAEMPDFAMHDPKNMLMQGEDGKFVEAGGTSGIGTSKISRGAALMDFNLDGLVDAMVVNRWENVEVFRNVSSDAGNWIEFALREDGANRDAIGAWIEVKVDGKVMAREAISGGGHVSGQLGFWHFGLGPSDKAEVRITWPHGEAGSWAQVAANGFYLIEKGKDPAAITVPE